MDLNTINNKNATVNKWKLVGRKRNVCRDYRLNKQARISSVFCKSRTWGRGG